MSENLWENVKRFEYKSLSNFQGKHHRLVTSFLLWASRLFAIQPSTHNSVSERCVRSGTPQTAKSSCKRQRRQPAAKYPWTQCHQDNPAHSSTRTRLTKRSTCASVVRVRCSSTTRSFASQKVMWFVSPHLWVAASKTQEQSLSSSSASKDRLTQSQTLCRMQTSRRQLLSSQSK